MSSHVSVAQRIPAYVLHNIFDYATKIVFDIGNKRDSVVKECLSVCSMWRQAALEYTWRELSLVVNNQASSVYVNYPEWAKRFKVPENATTFVRKLSIRVSMYAIETGLAFKLLLEYIGEGAYFPLANKLGVKVVDSPTMSKLPTDTAIRNVVSFAQLLNSMTEAPAAATKIKYSSTNKSFNSINEVPFGVLVNSLSSGTKSSAVNLLALNLKLPSTVENLSVISALEVNCKKRLDLHMQLVHKCANTLVALDVGLVGAKTLFHDVEGNSVVYPNMQELQLIAYKPDGSYERPLVPDIVPFPELKNLRVLLGYPFGDDVLFRGNNSSLEILTIWADRRTVRMLNSSPAFGQKFQSLRKVAIHDNFSDEDPTLVPADIVAKFLGTLVNSVCNLKIVSPLSTVKLLPVVHNSYGCANVQVLMATFVSLSIFDILGLLKALPALAKLTCTVKGLGFELEHIATEELPDHIASSYNGVGKQLSTLRASFSRRTDKTRVAMCIALLALASPKLCHVSLPDGKPASYYARIAEMVKTEPFRKYAPQLRRIHFSI